MVLYMNVCIAMCVSLCICGNILCIWAHVKCVFI